MTNPSANTIVDPTDAFTYSADDPLATAHQQVSQLFTEFLAIGKRAHSVYFHKNEFGQWVFKLKPAEKFDFLKATLARIKHLQKSDLPVADEYGFYEMLRVQVVSSLLQTTMPMDAPTIMTCWDYDRQRNRMFKQLKAYAKKQPIEGELRDKLLITHKVYKNRIGDLLKGDVPGSKSDLQMFKKLDAILFPGMSE